MPMLFMLPGIVISLRSEFSKAPSSIVVIPSGRTINKVMYVNPPVSQAALFANYGGIDIGFGGGYDPSLAAKLEKDLSDEWVEYWALKDEAYRQHILAECKQVQKERKRSYP